MPKVPKLGFLAPVHRTPRGDGTERTGDNSELGFDSAEDDPETGTELTQRTGGGTTDGMTQRTGGSRSGGELTTGRIDDYNTEESGRGARRSGRGSGGGSPMHKGLVPRLKVTRLNFGAAHARKAVREEIETDMERWGLEEDMEGELETDDEHDGEEGEEEELDLIFIREGVYQDPNTGKFYCLKDD